MKNADLKRRLFSELTREEQIWAIGNDTTGIKCEECDEWGHHITGLFDAKAKVYCDKHNEK